MEFATSAGVDTGKSRQAIVVGGDENNSRLLKKWAD
jgi:hypothetical protein